MSTSSEQIRRYSGLAVFSFGFRPFFLSGALLASAVPILTAFSLGAIIQMPGATGVLNYHAHEMLFGYLGAVVAGFILTAVPNWTGRLPIAGWRLAILWLFWLTGRLAMFFAEATAPTVAALGDAPFLFILCAVIWREIISGKNWRNLPVAILATCFAAGNAAWHIANSTGMSSAVGLRGGAAVIILLLALIGGRITPSFTRNWFAKTNRPTSHFSADKLDQTALVSVGIGALFYVAAPQNNLTGWLLLIAAALLVARLSRWRGWLAIREPLLAILHIGYLWLAASIFLMGVSILAPSFLPSQASLHALTAGAAGVMTLAVLTRATLGHTGRALKADSATVAIYALVNLGALARVAASSLPINYPTALEISATLWSGAFLLFAVYYGRYLLTPQRV